MEPNWELADPETVDLVQSMLREICRIAAPTAESRKRITISLGKKRYAVELTMKAEELKPRPAPLIPLPIDGRKKGR
jgi:hypothetical protein